MGIYRRGSTWHYRFMINGQEWAGSCKTEDEKQAQEYHDRMRAQAWRRGMVKEKPKHTVAEAIQRYWQDKNKKKSLRDDVRSGKFWIEQFTANGVTDLSEISSELIREIRDTELDREGRRGPLKPATVDRKLAFLRSVVRAAERKWEWIDHAPYVELFNEEEARERYLEPHEVARLVKALPQPYSDMAMFAVSTGLRRGNVFGLEWENVNLVTRVARFPKMKMKNGKPFSIALNDTAIRVIRGWIGRHKTHVFCRTDGEIVKDLPHVLWKKALSEAGLSDVRWHDLRHTWASLMRQSGVKLSDLMEMGGWQSEKMVQRYAHLNVDHLRPMAAVMDEILGAVGTRGVVQNLHTAHG